MGATTPLSLLSTIDRGSFATPNRIGVFSYGSGCCSEFFSGVASATSQERVRQLDVDGQLRSRQHLALEDRGRDRPWVDTGRLGGRGRPLMVLKRIRDFHREYEWIS